MQTGDDRKGRRKPCPSDNLYIINLARKGLDSNPGICGVRAAKIRRSHGKELLNMKKWMCFYIKCSPISGREVLPGKFPRLRPVVLLVGGNVQLKMRMQHWWNDIEGGNGGKKASTSATLSNKNIKRSGLGSNQGLPRSRRPETNNSSLGKTL
jgi:hypothetical protein